MWITKAEVRAINARFDAVDARLDARFDAVNSQFAAVNSRLDTLIDSVAQLHHDLAEHIQHHNDAA